MPVKTNTTSSSPCYYSENCNSKHEYCCEGSLLRNEIRAKVTHVTRGTTALTSGSRDKSRFSSAATDGNEGEALPPLVAVWLISVIDLLVLHTMRGGIQLTIALVLTELLNPSSAIRCDRTPEGHVAPKIPADNRFQLKISGSPEKYVPGEGYTSKSPIYRTEDQSENMFIIADYS
ncbi:Spondin-1 [Homalodisca vitripennis]|nr:Spondin-1 [Homalodisca vitripennis]